MADGERSSLGPYKFAAIDAQGQKTHARFMANAIAT
jgi:hypothetical protein